MAPGLGDAHATSQLLALVQAQTPKPSHAVQSRLTVEQDAIKAMLGPDRGFMYGAMFSDDTRWARVALACVMSALFGEKSHEPMELIAKLREAQAIVAGNALTFLEKALAHWASTGTPFASTLDSIVMATSVDTSPSALYKQHVCMTLDIVIQQLLGFVQRADSDTAEEIGKCIGTIFTPHIKAVIFPLACVCF